MSYLFDPNELHSIARGAIGLSRDAMVDHVVTELSRRRPGHIARDVPWMFNNAGGAMGVMKLLHASLNEYVLVFGSPIGTEGHSGRYRTEVWDFMMAGEMWCYTDASLDRAVFRPGDAAYLGEGVSKGYRIPDHAWMLEYARGPIPLMLPFGLADTVFSTLDRVTLGRTIYHYGRLVTRELFGRRGG